MVQVKDRERTKHNMELGAIDFIKYSKYFLCNYPEVISIPSLHSNTSTLEAHFSLIFWYSGGTASNRESTFNAVDNENL